MNIVKENFPDVPERCIDCPALFRMASDINFALGVSTDATSLSMETNDPATFASSDFVASISAEVAGEQMETYTDLANELVNHCETGPMKMETRSKVIRRRLGSTSCGSSHAIPDSIKGSWKDI